MSLVLKRLRPVEAPLPEFVPPCLASLVTNLPAGERWIHEIKHDGYRLQARLNRGAVTLRTGSGFDWTERFPGISQAVAGIPAETALIDGEAVVLDVDGVSDFSALQDALSLGRPAAAAMLYAFDLLYVDGEDIRGLRLIERRDQLDRLLRDTPPSLHLRFSEHLENDGGALLRHACAIGLEGVVSKRRDMPYRSGRCIHWLKVRCTQEDEFIIAGYLPVAHDSRAVGALILGRWQAGKLMHVGKTGGGFTGTLARNLARYLNAIHRHTPPFAGPLPRGHYPNARWAEPKLVAEIEFRGWTADRLVRHAIFKGLVE
jgi:bifunctional non-homologous end joining protein LigD